jgi:hypothetical protein
MLASASIERKLILRVYMIGIMLVIVVFIHERRHKVV